MIEINNLFELILEVKVNIALFDENVWIKMVLYDKEFKCYAYKKEGLKQFVDHFTQKINNKTTLFGKLHSIDDKPAIISGVSQSWYYQEKLHRENDLPAIIHTDGDK